MRADPPASTRGSGRPDARAEAISSSRSIASPLGSITIAPWTPSISRHAIHASLTVLPDPVAPTTSVCEPEP